MQHSKNTKKLQLGRVIKLKGRYLINNIDDYDDILQKYKIKNWVIIKSNLAIERSLILYLINQGHINLFDKSFVKDKFRLIYEAISNLQKRKIIENKEKIYSILKEIYNMNKSPGYLSNIRKSICYIDYMLNSEDISES